MVNDMLPLIPTWLYILPVILRVCIVTYFVCKSVKHTYIYFFVYDFQYRVWSSQFVRPSLLLKYVSWGPLHHSQLFLSIISGSSPRSPLSPMPAATHLGTKSRFLSFAPSKFRLCSANHRAGYFSNLACDWLSIVWVRDRKWAQINPAGNHFADPQARLILNRVFAWYPSLTFTIFTQYGSGSNRFLIFSRTLMLLYMVIQVEIAYVLIQ